MKTESQCAKLRTDLEAVSKSAEYARIIDEWLGVNDETAVDSTSLEAASALGALAWKILLDQSNLLAARKIKTTAGMVGVWREILDKWKASVRKSKVLTPRIEPISERVFYSTLKIAHQDALEAMAELMERTPEWDRFTKGNEA